MKKIMLGLMLSGFVSSLLGEQGIMERSIFANPYPEIVTVGSPITTMSVTMNGQQVVSINPDTLQRMILALNAGASITFGSYISFLNPTPRSGLYVLVAEGFGPIFSTAYASLKSCVLNIGGLATPVSMPVPLSVSDAATPISVRVNIVTAAAKAAQQQAGMVSAYSRMGGM